MTTAEMLLAEGKTEGKIEGEALGRAGALTQMLTVKFGTLPKDVSEKVKEASIGQIQAWTARAVTADKLDDVFG